MVKYENSPTGQIDNDYMVLYNVDDIQKIFRIGRTQAYKLMNAKGFPSFRVNNRLYVQKEKLETWIGKYTGRRFMCWLHKNKNCSVTLVWQTAILKLKKHWYFNEKWAHLARSAKPLFPSSNLGGASMKWDVFSFEHVSFLFLKLRKLSENTKNRNKFAINFWMWYYWREVATRRKFRQSVK